MKRLLLIDGDMVAYRVASAEEKGYDFGETFILSADADQGRENLDRMVSGWMEALGADHAVMTLTDSENYRKEVMPSYKSNRAGVRRPMILGAMREHVMESYDWKIVPTLEADDVMGIIATHPKLYRDFDEKVIVTWDKDLRTVPGLHWNPEKGWKGEGEDRRAVIDKVSPKEADLMFYSQVLSGDAVDGYPGCPGVGKKRAEQIVRNGTFTFPEERELKSGPNKGEVRVKWMTKHVPNPWLCVVSHYEKAGLTEADALQTARVARILRASDYAFKKKEPILWQPN